MRQIVFWMLVGGAVALSFVASCREGGGDGDVDGDVDGDTDADGDSDSGGDADADYDPDLDVERPEPPSPCENSDCVAFCRLVGAETGACNGENCVCSGCDRDACDGYCFWWEEGQVADHDACTAGGCMCVGCTDSCANVCAHAREYDGRRRHIDEGSVSSCGDDSRCQCVCDPDRCSTVCGFGLISYCDGPTCLCQCTAEECEADAVCEGEFAQCAHNEPVLPDDVDPHDQICECHCDTEHCDEYCAEEGERILECAEDPFGDFCLCECDDTRCDEQCDLVGGRAECSTNCLCVCDDARCAEVGGCGSVAPVCLSFEPGTLSHFSGCGCP